MKEKLKNKKKEIIIIFSLIIILILFFSGFSIGKAYSNTQINGVSEVAMPILQVENGETLKINNKNNEGTYDFKIKNYNEEGKINQVDMDYYIEILPIDNEAISFELYKENEKLEIIDNKTTKFTLKKGTKKEDNYKIKIIYDENKNTTENIFEEVQIKVHSEQKRA